jgi:hypothetical protein
LWLRASQEWADSTQSREAMTLLVARQKEGLLSKVDAKKTHIPFRFDLSRTTTSAAETF